MQRTGSPITLAPPRGSNDGLLIQIENGNIIAEPVSIPPEENLSTDGRRLVVGQGLADGMQRIDEHGKDDTPIYHSREVQILDEQADAADGNADAAIGDHDESKGTREDEAEAGERDRLMD